jgi:hypothetical protein
MIGSKLPRRIAAVAAAVVGLSATAGAQQINTGSTGTQLAEPFGSSNTATYGQTFTAVAGFSQLDQFTFQFAGWDNGSALTFRGYIMAWDGFEATGPVLYQSALMNGTDAASPQTYTFNTGGIGVTAGQVYVAFVNASDYINATGGSTALMQIIGGSSDTPGEFVFKNNGGDFGALTTSTWDCHDGCNWGGPGADVAFTASFSNPVATPEPASLTLMGTGLFGLGMFVRRRAARAWIQKRERRLQAER